MWERFCFYGMRGMLTYFMINQLFMNEEKATLQYGATQVWVYAFSFIGGMFADKILGFQHSLFWGGLLMITGSVLLSINPHDFFFLGIAFNIIGTGFFKPNISSLVGQLYPANDTRKDSAYTIFYMGINLGGMFGPLICGFFGDTGNPADFKWAFLIGGIAMLISLVVQKLYHDRYVLSPNGEILGTTPGQNLTNRSASERADSHAVPPPPKWILNPVMIMIILLAFGTAMIGAMYLDTKYNYLFYMLAAAFIFIILLIFSDKNLTSDEKQRIWVLIIIAFFVVFFWGAYEQTGASLTLFADRQTNRHLWGSYVMPTSYFQSFNSAFIILLALPFAWMWQRMGNKQPATVSKMGIGLLLLALGYWWIAWGVSKPDAQKVSIIWLTGLYFLHTCGELCLSPIGLSLFNKLSPLRFASLLMAVWFLGNAGGNKLAGVLSALYNEGGKSSGFLGYQINSLYDFFMLFVFMGSIAGIILLLLLLLLLLSKKLQKMMHGIQ
jgi:POT family proton-dependent oligopeptide transporter